MTGNFSQHVPSHSRFLSISIGLALILSALSTSSALADITGLGDLEGTSSRIDPAHEFHSIARAISADGTTVIGTGTSVNGYEAFRWTKEEGITGLGDFPGGSFNSGAHSISPDGTTIVGSGIDENGARAYRWTKEEGLKSLDSPEGMKHTSANAISADGITVVGWGTNQENETYALVWTERDGIRVLEDLPGGRIETRAYAISSDGSVVVGSSLADPAFHGFRWTVEEGLQVLEYATEDEFDGGAYDISADGSTIVGFCRDWDGYKACRWTAENGTEHLGLLPGWPHSTAWAVSADGSIVVGNTLKHATPDTEQSEAFVWTEDGGIQSLKKLLIAQGDDLSGWKKLLSAEGISDDGHTIAGHGINADGNFEAFIATLEITSVPDDEAPSTVPGTAPTSSPSQDVARPSQFLMIFVVGSAFLFVASAVVVVFLKTRN